MASGSKNGTQLQVSWLSSIQVTCKNWDVSYKRFYQSFIQGQSKVRLWDTVHMISKSFYGHDWDPTKGWALHTHKIHSNIHVYSHSYSMSWDIHVSVRDYWIYAFSNWQSSTSKLNKPTDTVFPRHIQIISETTVNHEHIVWNTVMFPKLSPSDQTTNLITRRALTEESF